ncbi:MAG: flavin reductase family protein [Patulibacter sp.]
MLSAREFRDAFGAFATGVAVVTAEGPDGPVGLTTNALTSVSLDPPLFLICFAATSRTLPVVRDAGRLAVSILRASQAPMAARFAGKHDPAEKFHGIALDALAGVPTIAAAAATVAGEIVEVLAGGDHEIVLCRCLDIRHDPTAEPLLFHRGAFGSLSAT